MIASGYLPNSFTEIGQIIWEREEKHFFITIKTYCSQEICIDLMTPFTETVRLEIYGLSVGNYTVNVDGVQGSFILEIDNILLLDR